jgi:hypothetical protein
MILIKIIKKLLGICEHNWKFVYVTSMSFYDSYGASKHYNSLQFIANIMCEKCGRHKTINSDFFDKDSITSYCSRLKKTQYWYNMDDCREALLQHPNAKIVKKSFIIKLNKEYNLNLTVSDL